MTSKSSEKSDCLILNFWPCRNYGALLTCYGLYNLLNNLGVKTKVIKFFPKYFFERNYSKSFTEMFVDKHMELTEQVKSDEDFLALNEMASIFIAGSDQIWNPKIARSHHENVSDGIYQLDFVDSKHKKISYSASFGTDFFNGDDDEKIKFAERIKNLDAISVREDTGVVLLEKEFSTKSEQLIDGAFLISKDKLAEFIKPDNIQEKYIGCFALPYYSNQEWYKKYLDTIAKKLNIPIKYLPFEQTLPVEDWLSFINNAEFIISDSYHAIVFSIIFNKQFIQLQNAQAQSRFDSIYRLLGIEPTVLSENTLNLNENELFKQIDWTIVNKTIEKEVEKATSWLLLNIR